MCNDNCEKPDAEIEENDSPCGGCCAGCKMSCGEEE